MLKLRPAAKRQFAVSVRPTTTTSPKKSDPERGRRPEPESSTFLTSLGDPAHVALPVAGSYSD